LNLKRHGVSFDEATTAFRDPLSQTIVLDPDVAEYFPDNESVNEALRSLTAIIKRQKKARAEHER